MSWDRGETRRRWRDYRTAQGSRPVRDFLTALPLPDQARMLAALKDVAIVGLRAARHLRGDIYEVRAEGVDRAFRILFATEGRRSQVLLSLEGFVKKTQRTPPDRIALAQARLDDWRSRTRDRDHGGSA